uniref:Uncharacterized protein n=1 Tax=Plectus sambesii TaxID=2011161 RepID=A0A914WET2_9BILA
MTSINDEQPTSDHGFRKRNSISWHQSVCTVCGDRADSKHYGAYACNGCKGFFRRTIWNCRKYFCKHNGQCVITKEIRIACKACRFTKCIKVGMNPKELHSSRKTGSRKGAIWPTEHDSQQVIELTALDPHATALLPNPHFDRSQVDALLMLDRYIYRRVDPLTTAASSSAMSNLTVEIPFLTAFRQPSLVSLRTEILSSSHRVATVSDVIGDFQRKFVLFADWLKEFHDFRMLPDYVQLVLAKSYCPTYCWALCAWRTFCTDCPGLSYVNGSFYPLKPSLRCLPDSRGVITLFMRTVIGAMKSLKIDEIEYNLLKIISLFNGDSLDLNESEKELIREKRDKYVDILTSYVMSTYSSNSEQDAASRVGGLMLLLASLSAVLLSFLEFLTVNATVGQTEDNFLSVEMG